MEKSEGFYIQSIERARREVLALETREQQLVSVLKLTLGRTMIAVEKSYPDLAPLCHRIHSLIQRNQAEDFPLDKVHSAIEALSNGIMAVETRDQPETSKPLSKPVDQKLLAGIEEEYAVIAGEVITKILASISDADQTHQRACNQLIAHIADHQFDRQPNLLIERAVNLINERFLLASQEKSGLTSFLDEIQKNVQKILNDIAKPEEDSRTRMVELEQFEKKLERDMRDLSSRVAEAKDVDEIKNNVLDRFSLLHQQIQNRHAEERQRLVELHNQNQKLRAFLGTFAQSVRSYETQHKQSPGNAEQCPITGLPNESALKRRLAKAHERLRPGQLPLSLLIFDTENFTDQVMVLGEVPAKKILVVLVQEISKHIRYSDFFARVGDQQFVILLQECCGSDGLKIAEKIHQRIKNLTLQNGAHKINIVLSCGVAEIRFGQTQEQSQQIALESLHTALSRGGNCCVYKPR
jgi:diguanylate cyclase